MCFIFNLFIYLQYLFFEVIVIPLFTPFILLFTILFLIFMVFTMSALTARMFLLHCYKLLWLFKKFIRAEIEFFKIITCCLQSLTRMWKTHNCFFADFPKDNSCYPINFWAFLFTAVTTKLSFTRNLHKLTFLKNTLIFFIPIMLQICWASKGNMDFQSFHIDMLLLCSRTWVLSVVCLILVFGAIFKIISSYRIIWQTAKLHSCKSATISPCRKW